MHLKPIYLVAGLGNPGAKYQKTRHNIGFMVIDSLAEFFKIPIDRHEHEADWGMGFIEGIKTILVKPAAFMNRSGPPVKRLSDLYGISRKDMLIIHDDIDIDFERIKIKEKGGDGGHKGIRSIIDVFGEGDFSRLRIGVGRPAPENSITDYVLGHFDPNEISKLDKIIERARDAVVYILCKGTKEGMNRFNRRSKISS